ncbi:hypothetical protein QAD02_001147 [Eretmocerus hayati]|uniref:Uncharacterized protein n=1 Tax=Eretmocerus hayati TaxID=131215 RepID=A0ACC2NGH6_9HYME|nr:hypothetical protein QAD02_001147 [Eretmocerus hayati]
MVNNQSADKPGFLNNIVSYHGETKIKVAEYTYTWAIRDFANCYLKSGQYVTSPSFVAFYNNVEYGWILKLYPSGNSNYTSPTVQLVPKTNYSLEVYTKIDLTDSNRKKVFNFGQHVSLSGTNSITFYDTDLKEYLINGDLILVTKMFFKGTDDIIGPHPSESLDMITKAEHRLLEKSFRSTKIFSQQGALFFFAMFEHDMKENKENKLEIPDFEPAVIKEILRYIYAGKVENLDKLDSDLFLAANKYGITGLKNACEMTFIYNLDVDNVGDALKLADLCKAKKLLDGVLEFIKVNSNVLRTNEKFKTTIKNLSPTLLADVIDTVMSKCN